MSDPRDRPDETHAVHIHQRPPKADDADAEDLSAPRRRRVGEASQTIPTRAHRPQPGDSAAFSPLEIPLPPPAASHDLDFELELAPLGTELAPPAPAQAPLIGAEIEATSLLRPAAGRADLDVEPPPPLPTPHERSAAHSDKQTPFTYAHVPREPWWKRNIGGLVVGALVLAIGSYVYGCTAVMGDAVSFRRDMADDVRTEFNNMNAEWTVVTPKLAHEAVQRAAARHDLNVDRVDIEAQPIGSKPTAGGACTVANYPPALEFMSGLERRALEQSQHHCNVPEYVLVIRAHVDGRWGLYHHEFDQVARVFVNNYDPAGD